MSEQATAPARRPVVVWDLVLTIVLLVVLAGAGFVLFFAAVFLALASDSCGASSVCDTDQIATGMLVAMSGVVVFAVIAIVAAIIMLVLRRIAFWIPLAGIVLMIASVAVGAAITFSAVRPISG